MYAANYYSLDLTMLGQWVKLFSQGTPSKKNLQRVGSGCHAFFPEEKAQLYEWVKEVQQNNLAVSYSNLRIKMAKIISKSSKQTKDETKNWHGCLVPGQRVDRRTRNGKVDTAEFRSGNTDLAVIPGGLTSMCQPLDVCINKPFKDKLRNYWHEWMVNGGSENHLIYDDCEDNKDDESDKDTAGSDEDEEYDEQPDEGKEPDEGEEPNEGEESDEDEN
ncbi:14332_t:CDS:2, partial [Cetraspora pellucida]